MKVSFNQLDRGYRRHKPEFDAAALRVLESGWYVLGGEGEAFESEFAERLGTRHAIGVGTGLDALALSIQALGIGAGDEVIVPGNTFIATALAVTKAGATPVFAEPDELHLLDPTDAERRITERTRAIIAVHLYGQPADLRALRALADARGLHLIEDCAQSHFMRRDALMTGTVGTVGCFSFYPTKNLGAYGDGGAVVTDDDEVARRLRMLRNYGSETKYQHELLGTNSRLDEMQAALLRVRLEHYDESWQGRRAIAERYLAGIHHPAVTLPRLAPGTDHAWHLFVLASERRDDLAAHLAERQIGTQVHYPIPCHLQDCYADLGHRPGSLPITERAAATVLSLPLYDGMTEAEADHVIDAVNDFGGGR